MSKALREREIERRLREPASPEPPKALLDALRAEIPQELGDGYGGESAPGRPSGAWSQRRWQLVAATLFLGIVGLVVVDRVRYETPVAEQDRRDRQLAEASAPPGSEPNEDAVSPSPLSPITPLVDAVEPVSVTSAEEPPPSRPRQANEARDDVGTLGRSGEEGVELGTLDPTPIEGEEVRARERRQEVAKKIAIPDPQPEVETRRLDAYQPDVDRPLEPSTNAEPGPVASVAAPLPSAQGVAAPPPPPRGSTTAPRKLQVVAELPKPRAPRASTGGTAEPNDQAFGDMFFESAGVNPFIDTEDDRLSTFGLDVDTGSYTVMRSYLDRGELPPPAAIRVEEIVNYFSYGDRPPRRGDFSLSAQGAPTPYGEGERYAILRFGIHGRRVSAAARKPAVLTFVVDVSGSMQREDRLTLVKRSLFLLLDELRGDDRVGLVVYGDRGEVLLEPSGDHEAIRDAIERLRPGGSTNAEEGLILGYDLARRHYRSGALNRVILCSDGVANVGRTGPDSILERIRAAAGNGIELTTVGFGMGNYNDVLMERLADDGNGRYAYVDSLAEARRLFVEDLTGTLQTIAADAKVQVDFDPTSVARYRLLGYENRRVADERFRDDTVDAGEIGAGHRVTALYEIKLTPEAGPGDRIGTLRLRWRSQTSGKVEETAVVLRVRDLAPSWVEASPGLRLATLIAEFAEILRRSYWAREGRLDDVLARAQQLSPEFAGDARVAELVGLIGKAASLGAEPVDDEGD